MLQHTALCEQEDARTSPRQIDGSSVECLVFFVKLVQDLSRGTVILNTPYPPLTKATLGVGDALGLQGTVALLHGIFCIVASLRFFDTNRFLWSNFLRWHAPRLFVALAPSLMGSSPAVFLRSRRASATCSSSTR